MPELNPWFAKAAILAGSVVMVVIRAPHGNQSRTIKVVKNLKGRLEVVLLTLAWIGFFIPLIWVASPALSFADHPLGVVPYVLGVACLAAGLWLFYLSHANLGTNWSITLEVRENHQLVTHGIYRRIRHPMYAALLVYSIGQVLLVPNWVAGPSYLVPMALLVAFRLGPEERMMLEEFGDRYKAYLAQTSRLIPGVW